MVRDKDYIKFLKLIVSCISNGDYYSAKMLSNLELEKMKKQEIKEKVNNFRERSKIKILLLFQLN